MSDNAPSIISTNPGSLPELGGDTDVMLESPTKPTDESVSPTTSMKGAKRKSSLKRQVSTGRAYIQATYNNTLVTFTDNSGNVLAWSSAGVTGFRGPKKSTPYAASVIVKDACEKVKAYGMKEVNVFVRGLGSGRESAVRSLNSNGLTILAIKDITPIPHNGCRKRKVRRV